MKKYLIQFENTVGIYVETSEGEPTYTGNYLYIGALTILHFADNISGVFEVQR